MRVVGHRGAGYNTLESFETALKSNVYMVELDIRLCKTGEIIIFHDHIIEYNNIIKYPEDMTFEEIKEYNKDICTLEEVFDFIKGRCKIMIEIKKTRRDIVYKLKNFIKKQLDTEYWNKDNILVQSFYEPYLAEFNYNGIKKGLTLAGILFSTEYLYYYDFVASDYNNSIRFSYFMSDTYNHIVFHNYTDTNKMMDYVVIDKYSYKLLVRGEFMRFYEPLSRYNVEINSNPNLNKVYNDGNVWVYKT